MLYDSNEEFFEIICKHIETLAMCLLFMGEILMSRLSTPVIQSYIEERIIKCNREGSFHKKGVSFWVLL